MKKEINSIQNKKGNMKESETSSPATDSSDASASNSSDKKFTPKWGKPVIVFAPKKESKKKFSPKWGKPVFTGAPKLEKPVPAAIPSATSAPGHNVEGVKQVTVSAPIAEKSILGTTLFSSPASNHNVIQPIAVKGSNNKMFVGVVITVVVLLCTIIGYWAFQMNKSDKATEHVVPQEVVVAAAAVPEEDVRNMVTKWLTSWKSGDIKTYGSFYAADFESKGKNLDAWLAHKTNVSKKSKNINITIDNLQISADENKATAVFTQHYSSSMTKDSGKKTLELRKINNEWKIYREIM